MVAATSKREPRTSCVRPFSVTTRTHSTPCALPALGLDLLGQGAELELDALLEGGREVAGAGRDVVGRRAARRRTTSLAPLRRAVRATSRAVMPSPITATVCVNLTARPVAHALQDVEAARARPRRRGARACGSSQRADADDDGVEAGVEQAVGVDLVAAARTRRRSARRPPTAAASSFVHDLLGQAELGDAVAQRAAGLGVGVVDGDLVAALGEEPGGGQAGRAGADDGDALAGRACPGSRRVSLWSAAARCRAQMAMGSSTSPRRQTGSQ